MIPARNHEDTIGKWADAQKEFAEEMRNVSPCSTPIK